MPLVFSDDHSTEPRTHALLIGIGGYRHLLGGDDERPEVLQRVGVLNQLTSPPRSAVAFASWLEGASQRLRAPLGSVELLVSTSPNDNLALPDGVQGGAARAQVQDGYDAWRERCDRNEDNVAVFYFCGHGLEKSEQYLLAEDFGENPNNPWAGAFALDSTRLAFHACRAKTQCFFIDACRKLTSSMLVNEPNAMGLEIQNLTTPECAFNLTMKASAKNESALGPPNGVSYFTQALIRALNGAAARQGPHGTWVVETGQLSAHMTEIMRMVKESEGFPQRCSAHTTDSAVMVTVDVPRVPVRLECTPKDANAHAELEWRLRGGAHGERHAGAPWIFDAEPNVYTASATFPGGQFDPAEEDVFLMPPGAQRPLWCAR